MTLNIFAEAKILDTRSSSLLANPQDVSSIKLKAYA